MALSATFSVESSTAQQTHAVSYGQTVDLALQSLTGVHTIAFSIMSTSHASMVAPTITLAGSPTGATASFAMPADPGDGEGRAVIVKCLVTDSGGNTASSTRKVSVVNSRGYHPYCVDETLENSATHGWTASINTLLAGIATMPSLVNPTDNGKMLYADAGAYQLTAAPTAAGQVQRWTGTAWAPGALDLADSDAITGTLPTSNGGTGLTAPAAGDVNKMLYVSAANTYSLTSTVKTDGTHLMLGSNPAVAGGTGDLLTSNGFQLRSKTAGGTSYAALTVADTVTLGSSVNTSNFYNVATGGLHEFRVAGTTTVSVQPTFIVYPLGGTAASSGTFRVANGFTLNARDVGNLNNATLLSFTSSDNVQVGQDTVATSVHLRAASTVRVFAAGTEYATFTTNLLALLGSTELRFGTNPATGAKINVPHGVNVLSARDSANASNRVLIDWGVAATDKLRIGSTSVSGTWFECATGSTYQFLINGVVEYSLNATQALWNQNSLEGVGFASFGTAPADVGAARFSNNTSIHWRNAGGTGNVRGLTADGVDSLILGSSTNPANTIYDVATSFGHLVRVNGVTEYILDANRLNLASGNVLTFNTSELAGLVNFAHNVTLLSGRNSGGTANVTVAQWGGPGNHILFGAQTDVSGVDTDMATGGQAEWKIGGNLQVALNETNLQINSAIKWGGGTTAATGLSRLAHGATYLAGKDFGGTNDVLLARWGTTNDTLIFGQDTIAAMQLRASSTGVEIYTNALRRVLINNDRIQLESGVWLRGAAGADLNYNVNTGQVHVFMVNSTEKLRLETNLFKWSVSVVEFLETQNNVSISHGLSTAATDTTARTLTIKGQQKNGVTDVVAGAVLIAGGLANGSGGLHTGGALTLQGGDATGASGTRTGGKLQLRAGTGATANGALELLDGSTKRIEINGTGMGFFAATPIAKPDVSGSRGGNAALADLLTELANLGLITDSTTA